MNSFSSFRSVCWTDDLHLTSVHLTIERVTAFNGNKYGTGERGPFARRQFMSSRRIEGINKRRTEKGVRISYSTAGSEIAPSFLALLTGRPRTSCALLSALLPWHRPGRKPKIHTAIKADSGQVIGEHHGTTHGFHLTAKITLFGSCIGVSDRIDMAIRKHTTSYLIRALYLFTSRMIITFCKFIHATHLVEVCLRFRDDSVLLIN